VTEYLMLDSTRLSFAEYWRWKPGLPFLILAASKILRRRMGRTLVVPSEPAVEIVDPQREPPWLVAVLREAIAACEAAGRSLEFWYKSPTVGANVGLGAALISADGLSVAMAIVAATRGGSRMDVVLGLASRQRSGRILTTGAGKSLFNPAPEVEAFQLRGRSYPQLVEAHDRLVATRRAEIAPCGNTQELILELQRLQLRANVTRGVYVPASPDLVARLKQGSEARSPR
jgi:hypothetical protein